MADKDALHAKRLAPGDERMTTVSPGDPILQRELDYLRDQALDEQRLAATSWDDEGAEQHRAFAAVFRKYAAQAECEAAAR